MSGRKKLYFVNFFVCGFSGQPGEAAACPNQRSLKAIGQLNGWHFLQIYRLEHLPDLFIHTVVSLLFLLAHQAASFGGLLPHSLPTPAAAMLGWHRDRSGDARLPAGAAFLEHVDSGGLI